MLSRVLAEGAAEVRPVTWRRSLTVAPKGPRGAAARPPEEVTLLRTKLAEVTAAADQQVRQSYDSGLRAGEATTRQALEAETRAVLDRVAATISDVAATRADTIRRAEADTVRLAVEIARHVLHRELSVDPNALEALTRAAIEKLQAQEISRVRVHPDLEALLRTALEKTGRGQAIEVIADPSQAPGGILFDINRGILDASMDTQLDEIARGLTDQLEARL